MIVVIAHAHMLLHQFTTCQLKKSVKYFTENILFMPRFCNPSQHYCPEALSDFFNPGPGPGYSCTLILTYLCLVWPGPAACGVPSLQAPGAGAGCCLR